LSLTLAQIAARVAAHEARSPLVFAGRRAAVAMFLREGPAGPEVLLMKRREHAGDRWSGHVSLPGGKEHPGDRDLVATAVRETLEEVGIDLARSGRLVGRLDGLRAIAEGKLLPMTITPFVFVALDGEHVVALRDEAESTFWLPLAAAASGALDASYAYKLGPLPLELPCWRFDGYVVWGLTYQMLRGLIQVTGGG
jgi:8-oxo-dGTP pyrophosphatase MutT (NUDIX family)